MYIKCDILICGGGLAGLSLLYRAMKLGIWKDQEIIVVDRSDKTGNDKTWSFWKKEESCFDELIKNQWPQLYFITHDGTKLPLKTGDYTYSRINSIDFYGYVLAYLREFPNITFIQSEISSMRSTGQQCVLETPENTYVSTWLFNSVYKKPHPVAHVQYFLQHFKGIRIRVKKPLPAPAEAILMDFRTGQQHGTTFLYVFPMAADELFIEYTLFSKSVLPMEEYERELRKYIHEVLRITEYEILDEEYGVIPMTDHPFKRFDGNIVHIGTAGGDTRASTGYTFTNTQKTIARILQNFQIEGHPFFKDENIGMKQQLYDATLLNVLAERQYEGYRLFEDLFKKAPAFRIFTFLDGETSVLQDVFIMKSLRVWPFLKSFFAAIIHKAKISA